MLTDLDLSSPIAAGVVDVTDGDPAWTGEVFLSAGVADDLGVDVGDTLVLGGRWRSGR